MAIFTVIFPFNFGNQNVNRVSPRWEISLERVKLNPFVTKFRSATWILGVCMWDWSSAMENPSNSRSLNLMFPLVENQEKQVFDNFDSFCHMWQWRVNSIERKKFFEQTNSSNAIEIS